MSKAKAGTSSSLDDFLKEEGISEEVQEIAILRVFARKIREAMKAKPLSAQTGLRRFGRAICLSEPKS